MRVGWTGTRSVVSILVVLLGLTVSSMAQQSQDEVAYGHTITVGPGDTHGEIACVRCTVYVRGKVNGDIAVFGGRLVVEGTVNQDVAVFWGDIRLGDSAYVGGDIAAMGGAIKRSPSAVVKGDMASLGRGAFLAGVLGTFVIAAAILGGFIWFLVWLVRRGRPAGGQPVGVRRA